MPISVVMPALEMAQETGKLISWLKKEGEPVAKGEPLLEIETDKAVMEVESPADGVLAGVKAEPGAEVQVGRTIAWIVKPGETPPVEEGQAGPAAESGRKFEAAAHATAPAIASAHASPASSAEIKISPKARRLAKEKGVDLAQVRGSGPGGEILASDILAAAEGKSPVVETGPDPSPVGAQTLSPVARLMAERTTQSWTTVPHFFVTRELDATALNEVRQELAPAIQKSHGAKLTHSDLLIALVARVLAKHPKLNASWTGAGIRPNNDVNISLAMAVSEGVVAPVFPHANRTSLGAIAVQRRELTERARGNKLHPSDLAGGTFTISNLGMFDVDAFTAIITPPQAAILAVGRIADRVVAVKGQAAVRPMITLTLSSDHRVVDGARAAEFMRDLADAIADPEKWLGTDVQ
jgi:pyruvate dehydrogenase E2 component (dihydrolipoamide acetyltransferase)